MTDTETVNFAELNSVPRFSLSTIFAVSQIECARNQNQGANIYVFSGNFEKKYKGQKRTYQQFQIAIRGNCGNIHQAERFKYKILDKVAARTQKKEHCKLERSRHRPNFTGGWKRNNTRNECEVKQHRDATFFRLNHRLYKDILQSEKKSCTDRNKVKNIKVEIIIRSPGRNNSQSNKSDKSRNPSKFGYIFMEKNLGQNQRKQWYRPKNNHDLSQGQLDNSKNIQEKTYSTENSTNDIQEKLICFKRRFALSDYERQKGNQSEKKSEKSHLKSVQPLSHEFRNNIVGTANEHLTEKKRDSLPISIQSHKLSAEKSKLFITFMVKNENIF